MKRLELRVLGGFALSEGDGTPVLIAPRKARALLAYLALASGRPQPRERMATLLWADSNETQARTSLRQALATLRRALAANAHLIDAGADTVTLQHSGLWVDAIEFEQGISAQSIDELTRALDHYQGDLLDGLSAEAPAFEQWQAVERERLRALAANGLARVAEHRLDSGDHEGARHAGARLIHLDPLREDAHRLMMRLYTLQGRSVEAIKQYQQCRLVLARELGVTPTPQTEALYRDAVQGRKAQTPGEPPPTPTRFGISAPSLTTPTVRPVCVLFCDLYRFAGDSSGSDPEEVHDTLQRYRQLVSSLAQQYGGLVTNFIGSRLMVVFGVPAIHENDAARATQCALDVREQVRMLFSSSASPHQPVLGLVSGSVMAEESAGQFLVSGDPVSLGARVLEAAEPDEILCDDATHDAIAERVQSQARPNALVQGADRRIGLWSIQDYRRHGVSDRPFVGRRTELKQLAGVLDASIAENRLHVILVRGEAGIGKTRLVEQTIEMAKPRAYLWHRMQVLRFGSGTREGPIPTLLRALLDVGRDAVKARESIEAFVREGVLEPNLRIPTYELLEIDPPEAVLQARPRSDGDSRQQDRLSVMHALTAFRARQAPLLLAVEDVHWADLSTLELLARMAGSARNCRAVLVMTTRPEHNPIDHAWKGATGGAPVLTLDLSPLTRSEAMQLTQHYALEDAALVQSCVDRAEGNPFFLDQILRAAHTGGRGLPESIRSVVLARVQGLEAEDRALLQAASVLGQRFPFTALAHLLGDATEPSWRLLETGLLRRDSQDLVFAHALIQESIYDSMTRSVRNTLHEKAARWFAERDVALHARHMEAAHSEKAAVAYLRAAIAEYDAMRCERAILMSRRGLILASQPNIRHALHCVLGDALRDAGDVRAAVEAFGGALAEAETPREKTQALLGLASGLRILDRIEDALSAVRQAETQASLLNDPEAIARVHILRGNLYFPLARIDDCLAAHQAAFSQAERAGSAELEASALSGLGDANYLRGRMLSAAKHFSRCIDLAQAQGLLGVKANNLFMLAACEIYSMRFEMGLRHCEESLEIARELGDLRAEVVGGSVRPLLHLNLGQWNDARSWAEHTIVLARRLGAARFESEGKVLLSLALWYEGSTTQAEHLIEEVIDQSGEGSRHYLGPWALGVLAFVTQSESTRAEAILKAEQLLGQGSVSHACFHFRELAMESALRRKHWDEAIHHAHQLEQFTHTEPLPWTQFIIERAQVLAQIGAGECSNALRARLMALIDQARSCHAEPALALLSAAQEQLSI